MKYEVYYGYGIDEISNKKILGRFDSIDEAENFIKNDILKNHSPNYYLRTTFISKNCRWYDHGSHTQFYLLISDNNKQDWNI